MRNGSSNASMDGHKGPTLDWRTEKCSVDIVSPKTTRTDAIRSLRRPVKAIGMADTTHGRLVLIKARICVRIRDTVYGLCSPHVCVSANFSQSSVQFCNLATFIQFWSGKCPRVPENIRNLYINKIPKKDLCNFFSTITHTYRLQTYLSRVLSVISKIIMSNRRGINVVEWRLFGHREIIRTYYYRGRSTAVLVICHGACGMPHAGFKLHGRAAVSWSCCWYQQQRHGSCCIPYACACCCLLLWIYCVMPQVLHTRHGMLHGRHAARPRPDWRMAEMECDASH